MQEQNGRMRAGTEPNRVIDKAIAIPVFIVLFLSPAIFPVKIAGAQTAQGLDPSSYRLIGTIMAGGLSGAVLVDAKGEQAFYRLHDNLPDGSQVADVRSNSILLKWSDSTFYEIFISHDTKTAVPQAGPPQSAVSVTPEAAPESGGQKELRPHKRARPRRPLPGEE